jgi:hypothetical protein
MITRVSPSACDLPLGGDVEMRGALVHEQRRNTGGEGGAREIDLSREGGRRS